LPFCFALFPPPSVLAGTAKIPRSPFRSAEFFVIVLPGSSMSSPSSTFASDEFSSSRFPVEPTNVWMPSLLFELILFWTRKLLSVLKSSIPLKLS
jgi:hypothetical protein